MNLAWCVQCGGDVDFARARHGDQAVLELVAAAPEEVRRVLGLAEEDGEIVWWWPRLTLLARRPEVAKSSRET